MNKFLVIGGTHGNEPLGIEVCKQLEKLKLPYLDVLYANQAAIEKGVRFVEEDLNRVYPGSDDGSIEARRAKEIVNACKGYDFVIDFHNTHCPENDCGFVAGDSYQTTVQLAQFLGLNRVINATYDCINKYVPGCLSVEISLDSPLFNVEYWVKKMASLKDFNPKRKYGRPEYYTFYRRITREEQEKFNFPKWRAFQSIPKKDVSKLTIDTTQPLHPIFVDDAYTPYNYAALLTKDL